MLGLSYSRARALFSYIFFSFALNLWFDRLTTVSLSNPPKGCPSGFRAVVRPKSGVPRQGLGKLLKTFIAGFHAPQPLSYLSGSEVLVFPCNLPGLPSELLLLDCILIIHPFYGNVNTYKI